MEGQRTLQNFCGDSYGNLDLNDVANENHSLIKVEGESHREDLQDPHISKGSLKESGSDSARGVNVTEKAFDNYEEGNEDYSSEPLVCSDKVKNKIESEQEMDKSRECNHSPEDKIDADGKVDVEKQDHTEEDDHIQTIASANHDDDDDDPASAVQEGHQSAESEELERFENLEPDNERGKSPRERLSIHITKGHESDGGDSDSEGSYENSEDVGNVNDADLNDDARSSTEGARSGCSSPQSPRRPQTTSTMREVPGGLRAKANTPASMYTNQNELESPKDFKIQESGRGVSRESRDEVFQRAMTLMSNRCTSARAEEGVLYSDREPPFGIYIPQYFYVQQQRPAPMAPLKVWRGYKGNVYFEPINIQRIQTRPDSSSLPLERVAREQTQPPASAGLSHTRAPTRATTAGQSTKSHHYGNFSPQVFVLDKQAVISSFNTNIQNDLRCLEGMESTGSLAVRPFSSEATFNPPKAAGERRILYRREKICKGPNFHVNTRNSQSAKPGKNSTGNSRRSSNVSRQASQRKVHSFSAGPRFRSRSSVTADPNLIVSGDKFAPPTVMSPLLRTTGQFALSNQRGALNTPDILGAYDKLPPVHDVHDITRIPYSHSPVYAEDMKPFIRCSPEVNAHHDRGNVNYC